MGKARPGVLAAVVVAAGALTLTACGGGGSSSNNSAGTGGTPTKGGKITYLEIGEQFNNVDPQRVYTQVKKTTENAGGAATTAPDQ